MEHIIITITALAVYFLPTLIALTREHHNKTAIIVTNLWLGWTGVGWLVALIWALTKSIVINNMNGATK